MSKKIKLGVIGCGPRGRQMAYLAQLLPGICELTALSDPDLSLTEKIAADFPEAKFFNDSDALLNSGLVDSVIIETPPAAHTEYLIKALDLNINVLGEIPAVNSVEEGELLWEKVNASKALYMCGATPNYRAKTIFLKKIKPLLGKIAYVESEYISDRRRVKKTEWRRTFYPCTYCTHSLGPILEVMEEDEFETVSCVGIGDPFNCGVRHGVMTSVYRTRNDVVVKLLLGSGIPHCGPHHATRIFAEHGYLELYNERAKFCLDTLMDTSARKEMVEVNFTPLPDDRPLGMKIIDEEIFAKADWGHNGSDNLMLTDFADAIINNKPSPIGIRKALAMTLPGIYAAKSSDKKGGLEKIIYPWQKK